MLYRVLVIVLLASALTACGDDDAGVTTEPTFACPAPTRVASEEELAEALSATLWATGSAELEIDGTVALESTAVPLSEDCLGRTDCRHEAALYLPDPLPGVVLEGPGVMEYNQFQDSRTFVFTDAAVRLLASLADTHPGPFNYVPNLVAVAPCGTPCAESLRACPNNGLCYDFEGYYLGWCLGCEERPERECACRDADGPLPEGAPCGFWASGDVRCSGSCQEGVCVSDDGAGC